jgi:hypothetical protein
MCDAFNRGATDGIGRSEATTILPVPRENAKSGSGHAIKAQNRSTGVTKAIEVRERESKALVPVRILGLAGDHSEKVAVLELQTTVFSAVALRIRTNHLVPDEHVVSLGYPNSRLRFADGRFVEYGADKRFAGAALLETHDGNDRLVLDHGASGAPVLDCSGRVVAVVSTLITQILPFPSGPVRVSTAWQTPNAVSIPAEMLRGFVRSE